MTSRLFTPFFLLCSLTTLCPSTTLFLKRPLAQSFLWYQVLNLWPAQTSRCPTAEPCLLPFETFALTRVLLSCAGWPQMCAPSATPSSVVGGIGVCHHLGSTHPLRINSNIFSVEFFDFSCLVPPSLNMVLLTLTPYLIYSAMSLEG